MVGICGNEASAPADLRLMTLVLIKLNEIGFDIISRENKCENFNWSARRIIWGALDGGQAEEFMRFPSRIGYGNQVEYF